MDEIPDIITEPENNEELEYLEDDDPKIQGDSEQDPKGKGKLVSSEQSELKGPEITQKPGVDEHMNTYKTDNLGNEFTEEQSETIRKGDFFNMYVGNFWVIKGFHFRIVHLNYWLNTGDGGNICKTNHVVIMPDEIMYLARMNFIATTRGGYLNSEFANDTIEQARDIVYEAFGYDHILNHREKFSCEVDVYGNVTNEEWTDCDLELINTYQLEGEPLTTYKEDLNAGIDTKRFKLFEFEEKLGLDDANKSDEERISYQKAKYNNRYTHWWLRDICSPRNYQYMYPTPKTRISAATEGGIRPAFAIY